MNAITGLPLVTGPEDLPADVPVNHVLPAWDLIAGAHAAFTLMAAERKRRMTGEGGEVRTPLVDIAATTLGHLGQIAEVSVDGPRRIRSGNDLYGAFGCDFFTADGKRLILVGITARQWKGIIDTFGIGEQIAALESRLGVSFECEGPRFLHRKPLFDMEQKVIGTMSYADTASLLNEKGICWETYRSLEESMSEEPGFVTGNPIFNPQTHPSGHTYLIGGSPATFPALPREEVPRAPRLGEHTEEVLAEVLSLPAGEIARLHDQGIVAGPQN